MKRIYWILIPCILLLSCTEKRNKEVWYASRYPFNPPTYVCYKAPSAITIDGILSPEEWEAVPWSADFVDIEGDSQPQPYHQTRVKMVHNEKGMYFAVQMEEPHIWATITEHDAVIYQDNDFELFLNPTNDTHNYLEYEINALGTEWDLFLSKPYRDNPVVLNNWEFRGIQSAIHIDGTLNNPTDEDTAWSIEIFLPWSDIYQVKRTGKAPAEGEQMRVNFSRVQWTTKIQDGKYVKVPMPGEDKIREHNWVWAPTGAINIHMPEYWGYVQFSEQTAGNTQVAFVPRREEEIKWMLRNLYYRQREYMQAFAHYASNLADLKPEEILPAEMRQKLHIETTETMYEITLQEKDTIYRINHEGLVSSRVLIQNQ